MDKQHERLNAVSSFGILCAIYTIIMGFGFVRFMVFLGLGILLLSISLLIFKKNIIVKVLTTLLSICSIAFYLLIVVALIKSGGHYSWGVGLVFYFPIFAWSVAVIVAFIKDKNKA